MHRMESTHHPVLTKSRRILDRTVTPITGDIAFMQVDDDTGKRTTALRILEADWIDMGRPERVTVTVEPGDHLNPPAERIGPRTITLYADPADVGDKVWFNTDCDGHSTRVHSMPRHEWERAGSPAEVTFTLMGA